MRMHADAAFDRRNLPSWGKIIGSELCISLFMLVVVLLSVILIFTGVLLWVCFFLSEETRNQPWAILSDLWQPWLQHWTVWKWMLMSNAGYSTDSDVSRDNAAEAERREREAQRQRKQRLREAKRYQREYYPTVDLGEFIEMTWVAFQGTYWATLVIMAIVTMIPAAPVVAHLNRSTLSPVVQATPTPTYELSETQKQEQEMGAMIDPEKAVKLSSKSDFNNLAILPDSGASPRYSATITFSSTDKAWIPSRRFTRYQVQQGRVQFKDDNSNSYTLNLDQPFWFENAQTIVYCFTDKGLEQAVKTDLVKIAPKYGAKESK